MRFFVTFMRLNYMFFLEITYADSRQHCVRSSEGKTYEKIFGAYILVKRVKIRPEISFFFNFLKFGSIVFIDIVQH